MTTTIQTTLVDAGINASVTPINGGINVKILTFKLGSGVGYVPTRTQTALQGTILYQAPITDVIKTGPRTLEYLVILPSTVGTFDFGEIGLYTENGSLVHVTTFPNLHTKLADSGADIGNELVYRIPVNFAADGANVNIQTANVSVGRLGEVASFNALDRAAAATTNAYLIPNVLAYPDPTIAFSPQGSTRWFFSNYRRNYLGVPIVAVGTGWVDIAPRDLITVQNAGDIIFQLISGPNEGRVRAITSVTSGAGGNLRLNYSDALTQIAVGNTLEILTNINRFIESQLVVQAGEFIPLVQKAAANGVATLDSNAKIPITQINLATENVAGIAQIATTAETTTGTDDQTIVTPLKLKQRLDAGFIPLGQRAAANGVATLDGNAKIPVAQLPDVAVSLPFEVASQEAMLALTAQRGDIAIRTDLNRSYVLSQDNPAVLGNWIEIRAAGLVQSVNSRTGNVVLGPADVGAVPTARQITSTGLITRNRDDLAGDISLGVDIATAAETLAGLINDKAVTPASLTNLINLINAATPQTRNINTGGGILQGGGSLSADLLLQVIAATGADILAETSNSKAVTPASFGGLARSFGGNGFVVLPTGFKINWGQYRARINGEQPITVYFGYPFVDPPYFVGGSVYLPTFRADVDMWIQSSQRAVGSASIAIVAPSSGNGCDGFDWFAFGY